MKYAIAFNCSECTARPAGYDGPITYSPGSLIVMPYSEGPRYEASCAYGHVTHVVLSEQKFEILFEIGAHAILDGYYREAIASFTSSLERFYEFGIRCFLKRQGVEIEVVASAWKNVSNQSERQYGAFVYLWLAYFKDAPAVPSTRLRTFRNDIIHKGVIPNREEAVWYGDQTLLLLRPQLAKLMNTFGDEILEIKREDYYSVCEPLEPVVTMAGGTILSTTNNVPDAKPLEQHLRHLTEYNKMVQGYVDSGYTTLPVAEPS